MLESPSQSIERLACDLLARHGLDAPPVNVDEIAQREGLNFEIADTATGHYYREPDGRGRALIPASEHPLRRRFTKGHELAHHLLDEPREVHAEGYRHLQLPSGYRGRDRHWAHERFAAALLMPRDWVGTFMRDQGWRLERGALVVRVARTFDVSRAAAEVRLRELGHIER